MAQAKQGRGFAGMDEEEHREISRRGGQASHEGHEAEEGEEDEGTETGDSTETTARGGRQAGSQAKSSAGGQGAKRVISRAVRVLNEIESRLHELKEELEQQQGGDSEGSETQARGKNGSQSKGQGGSQGSSNGGGRGSR